MLYAEAEWLSGTTIRGSLYDQEAAFGAGLEYKTLFPLVQGTFAAELQWHHPTWEIFEALAYNGREDRFYALVDGVCNRYMTWSLGGGMRRVGISGTPNGFVSALANSSVYLNFFIPNPIIGLYYTIDAEYVVSRQSKRGSDGVKFFPVPYTSFEEHTFCAFLNYTYQERLYISGYAGRTFNRIGLAANTYGIEVKYIKPVPCGWEAKISFTLFPSTIVTGATEELLTATLLMRF